MSALYLGALDQIAWLTNLRGYHLPHPCAAFWGGPWSLRGEGPPLRGSEDIAFESTNASITVRSVKEADPDPRCVEHFATALSRLDDPALHPLSTTKPPINARDHSPFLVRVLGRSRPPQATPLRPPPLYVHKRRPGNRPLSPDPFDSSQ